MWLRILLLALAAGAAGSNFPATAQPSPALMEDPAGAPQCAEARHRHHAHARAGSGALRASAASAAFDATYYHLHLRLDFDQQRIAGTTRIEGRAVGAVLDVLDLDLSRVMAVSAVAMPDGQPLAFRHTGDVLSITLAAPVLPGERLAVEVTYAGQPQATGFGSFGWGRLPTNTAYAWTLSQPYGARDWWPGKDHPSDKADSSRVTVTVPALLRVGSNGLLVSTTTADGLTTYDWKNRYPIAPYLISLAAADYAVYEQIYARPPELAALYGPLDLPILHYVYRDGSDALPDPWARVTDMLAVFETWFGPYPFPLEKYGHAQFAWGGGMEHQTMSSIGGTTSYGLIAHELAHMWYGDHITTETWPHLWLNEGFATYAELLYWQQRASAFPGTFDQQLTNYLNQARQSPGTLVITGSDTLSVNTLFDGRRVYAKGGIVLHMLRGVVGDAVFQQLLQTYTATPALRYGTATTADFEAVAEAVSGRDLSAFFRQWVTEGTGYPTYAVTWTANPVVGGYEVQGTLRQTHPSSQSNTPVFEMPVPFLIRTEAGSERFVLENDAREQDFTFRVAARPTALVVDPDRAILRGSFVAGSDTEEESVLPTRTTVTALFPQPASGAVTLRYTLAQPVAVWVRVYDLLGREVLRQPLGVQAAGLREQALDLRPLAPGTYALTLDDGSVRIVRRLTVGR